MRGRNAIALAFLLIGDRTLVVAQLVVADTKKFLIHPKRETLNLDKHSPPGQFPLLLQQFGIK